MWLGERGLRLMKGLLWLTRQALAGGSWMSWAGALGCPDRAKE